MSIKTNHFFKQSSENAYFSLQNSTEHFCHGLQFMYSTTLKRHLSLELKSKTLRQKYENGHKTTTLGNAGTLEWDKLVQDKEEKRRLNTQGGSRWWSTLGCGKQSQWQEGTQWKRDDIWIHKKRVSDKLKPKTEQILTILLEIISTWPRKQVETWHLYIVNLLDSVYVSAFRFIAACCHYQWQEMDLHST